ncbi:Lsr2 dimerization domain-containing protein [Kribbella sp. CWNU-51]
MAQRVEILLTDDLDGTDLPAGRGETVTFALDGSSYEIDLATKNAAALRKALAVYIDAA